MGRGLLHVAEAGLCLNFTEQIHISSEPLSIIPDVKPNCLLHVTRNLFTVFGLITIDHVCVVWGWICCVGDGCVWNTKWANNQFNWCYGWESMWDTVQVSKGFFRHLQLWRAKLITVKSVIILCQPERALFRLTIVWFCHFLFKHIRYKKLEIILSKIHKSVEGVKNNTAVVTHVNICHGTWSVFGFVEQAFSKPHMTWQCIEDIHTYPIEGHNLQVLRGLVL